MAVKEVIYNKHINEYINIVEQNIVRTCEEQKLLIKHIQRCFTTEDLFVDEEKVEKYFTYQKYFPFNLFPWEKFCFTLHNCTFKSDGRPRWPELLIYIGRGGGKNGYMSFEDFCLMTPTHGIAYYNVDTSANSEDQARRSFDELYEVLENPKYKNLLSNNFSWNKTEIKNKKTKSVYRFRTDNFKTKDSLRSGKINFDEVHAYENWDTMNVYISGLGKRPHPRITYATSDGDVRDGVLDELLSTSDLILRGQSEDNGFLPFICRLNDKNQVHDEKNWEMAIPSLPYMPDLYEEVKRHYVKYKENPSRHHSFMTKRMNSPEQKKDLIVATWDDILKTKREVPDLTGHSCVAGIDYMMTTDFMSVFLLFKIEGIYYGITHSWYCANSADLSRIKAPLKEWEIKRHITKVDDVEIKAEYVTDWLREQAELYDIKKVAIDEFRFAFLRKALEIIGFHCNDKDKTKNNIVRVRPSNIIKIVPLINSAFVNGSIIWGDIPLMRWYTNNVKLEPAPNNCYKYGKIEAKSRKTDGFMAYAAAMTIEDELQEYDMPPILDVIRG